MDIELKKIEQDEIVKAFFMQKKGFLPTYLNYFDKINPIFKSYSAFKKKFANENIIWFFIVYNGIKIGEIEIEFKQDFVHISDFFILSEYQNKGAGQQVLKCIHNMFSDYKYWHLMTIKQEKRNCHLYEKFGYMKTNLEIPINKRMTIIEYERKL